MPPSKEYQWWRTIFEHCRRREFVVALDLAAVSIVVIFLDKWITDFLAVFQQSIVLFVAALVPNRVQLSFLFAFLMVIIILYSKVSGDRYRADRGMFVLGCGAIAGFAADLLKMVFGRPRPGAESDIFIIFNFFGGGEHFDSFPSSHAAIAAGLAGALSTIWPRHRRLYFALAIAVAASRPLTGMHYVSDALLGFAVGLCIVILVEGVFGRVLQIHSPRGK
jgi:membrane-associated phospholipid phosphatase